MVNNLLWGAENMFAILIMFALVMNMFCVCGEDQSWELERYV